MAKTILLADDSITIQKIVNLTFTGEGIDVVTVSNGEAALKKIAEIHPDLVLADIFMPGKNGYEVCEHVKNTPELQHIPVILLVGAFEPFDNNEATRVKADGHLTKPFEIKVLISAVNSLVHPDAERPTDEDFEEGSSRQAAEPPERRADELEAPLATALALVAEESGEPMRPPDESVTPPPAPGPGYEASQFDEGMAHPAASVEPTQEETAEVPAHDAVSSVPQPGTAIAVEETDPLGLYSVDSPVSVSAAKALDSKSMMVDIWESKAAAAAANEVLSELAVEAAVVAPPAAPAPRKPFAASEAEARAVEQPAMAGYVAPEPPVEAPSELEAQPAIAALSAVSLGEEPAPAHPEAQAASGPLDNSVLIDVIATKVVEKLSREVIEKIAWEVIPDLAEIALKEHIQTHFKPGEKV